MTVNRAGLRLVHDAIQDALVVCPRCESLHIAPRTQPAHRGAVWRFKRCEACGHSFDAELDRP